VSLAYGSLCQVETQILIAESLGYGSPEAAKQLLADVAHVRRLLRGLLRRRRPSTDPS